MRALRRLVSEERPDIVHAHNWIYASFLPLKAFGNARLVVTLHDYGLVCAKKNFMHLGTQLCDGRRIAKCLHCATAHYGAAKAAATTLGNWASSFVAQRVWRHRYASPRTCVDVAANHPSTAATQRPLATSCASRWCIPAAFHPAPEARRIGLSREKPQ